MTAMSKPDEGRAPPRHRERDRAAPRAARRGPGRLALRPDRRAGRRPAPGARALAGRAGRDLRDDAVRDRPPRVGRPAAPDRHAPEAGARARLRADGRAAATCAAGGTGGGVTSVEALEHRLAALEHEVADLRRQVRGEGPAHLEQRARPAPARRRLPAPRPRCPSRCGRLHRPVPPGRRGRGERSTSPGSSEPSASP